VSYRKCKKRTLRLCSLAPTVLTVTVFVSKNYGLADCEASLIKWKDFNRKKTRN